MIIQFYMAGNFYMKFTVKVCSPRSPMITLFFLVSFHKGEEKETGCKYLDPDRLMFSTFHLDVGTL